MDKGRGQAVGVSEGSGYSFILSICSVFLEPSSGSLLILSLSIPPPFCLPLAFLTSFFFHPPFTLPSVHQPASQPLFHPSVHSSCHPSIHPSMYPSAYSSICPSPVSLPPIYPLHPAFLLSLHPSGHLPISLIFIV